MHKIGIFFGTDSGTTRLIAKRIARNLKSRLGEQVAAKPVNVNRIEADRLLAYQALILGTPTYGEGLLPGKENGTEESSWAEFLPQLASKDFSGIRIALYGLGDQETYPTHFADAIMHLYEFFDARGAEMVGGCDIEGYEFKRSKAVVNGRFVGLVLDQHLQHLLTDQRIDSWLDEILPQLIDEVTASADVEAAF
ncbi:MAG: flavodoxin [Candidatus Thiodiazotropha sp.]|nr:flavodoxin [Candidatus Thiodiazotropha taylori]MBT3058233.1 flavodoxin [Candidatus Thiodiazotropha sp. (ex Lucina pensylvanica)]MBV2093438.1 flavodoxin [Candidatus Thiodiazotropha sp. (ex Codakia orbicularis)]PUB72488.1 MAG: flavodoxin [gamma proteobacterium symbiont of Ctena orbiculata]MBT3062775.1 flavodoxin [Candidatus Thiodiazotropha sp. (ex Lucina pensylvanica)]